MRKFNSAWKDIPSDQWHRMLDDLRRKRQAEREKERQIPRTSAVVINPKQEKP